jgi:serine/threonine protein kinase
MAFSELKAHMDPRKQRIEAVFDQAVELKSPEERAAYLSQACGDEPQLRREIEELLQADERAGGFLAATLSEGGALPLTHTQASPGEQPGGVIGRYRLRERIGEGGCGVVYLAEQNEPVKRRVALKIIRPGLETKQVVARFEAERQALALMDHPNIAKVHDGGATDTGRLYFVMELVRGVPITQYCDANQLPTSDRLHLFVQVCQAVQHAHQKGIIHRDLKPSNILVTVNDGVPVPKVIDFGVAKATQRELTETTIITQFHHVIGTPAYMSPEQAEMTSLDIDTRSDIYALGVLLYEVLTGKTPFDADELLKAGLDEMRRTIREKEPERPSTRVSTLRGEELTTTAKRRGLDAPKLINVLRGDLDWIVMKCLEKDRSRRYETANGLAADVKRHLENEPVLARPPSVGYRFQKTFHRNKTLFASAALIVVTLAVAAVVSTWQAIEAKRERQTAQEQAQNARAAKDFIVEQMLALNPFWDSKSEISAEKQASVERIARAVEMNFARQPLTRAELYLALAAAYAGFGDTQNQRVQAQRSLEIRQTLLPRGHSDTLHAAAELAEAYIRLGQNDLADKFLAQWLREIRPAPIGPSFGEAWLLYEEGWLLRLQGQADDALPYLHRSIAILNRTLGTGHIRSRNVLWNLAVTTQEAGHLEEAERLWTEGLRESERDLGPEHFMTIQFKKGLAYFLLEKGDPGTAEQLILQILPIYGRLVGTNHNNALDAEGLLGQAYEQQGKIAEAARIYQGLYPRWARYFPYKTALTKCQVMANFFQRHGYSAQADAVTALLADASEPKSAKNAGYSATKQPP